MYLPKHFRVEEQSELHAFIQEHPFAVLVSSLDGTLEANHIPMLLVPDDEKGVVIRGHIAKANPLWKSEADEQKVLLIFNGPHGYVSPNYYPSKKEHQKAVPTWNYSVVHVRGRLSFQHDVSWKYQLLETMTDALEGVSQASPWKMTDSPKEFIQKMVDAVVGIEIEVDSIEGKQKLSQNRPVVDQKGVVAALKSSGDLSDEVLGGSMENVLKPD